MDCSNILTNNWIVGPVIFSSHQFLGKLVFEMVIQSHVERNVLLCSEHLTNFNFTNNSNIIQKEDEKSWDKKWIKKIVKITFWKYIVNMRWQKLWGSRTKREKSHYHGNVGKKGYWLKIWKKNYLLKHITNNGILSATNALYCYIYFVLENRYLYKNFVHLKCYIILIVTNWCIIRIFLHLVTLLTFGKSIYVICQTCIFFIN